MAVKVGHVARVVGGHSLAAFIFVSRPVIQVRLMHVRRQALPQKAAVDQ